MLVCLSASHRSAGFALLERLSQVPVQAVEDSTREVPGLNGAVVLSTCNRVELYLDVASAGAIDAMFVRLATLSGVNEDQLRAHMRVLGDTHVPEYLFSVSSGLESVAVGEGEISGQVRRSLQRARQQQLTTGALEGVFRIAAETSKGVKANTDLAGTGRSLVSLALDLAGSQVRDWATARILLIGTGAYAGASLKALEARGAGTVGVYSPSGRQHTLGERYDVTEVTSGEFAEEVSSADVVITCSTSDKYVLEHGFVRNTRLAPGHSQRQLIIDMGMPRNVDPLVGKLQGVDVLDLETIRLHAPLDDLDTTDLARCIVARAARDFEDERRVQRASALIASFRETIQGRVEHEISRLGVDETTAIAMRKLGNSLLHEPTVRIKELARERRSDEAVDAMRVLFDIDAPAAPATGAISVIAQLPDRVPATGDERGGCPAEFDEQ
ncbi:glutamyl-tRNA reductase [Gulosibacter sediminis]|uniref:glutamyl-tRNA reductase n=1 Tax=Gulosibacter sediminis TaxID=1729695 RepID=UPI0024A8EAB3|nr:glutamyl-tRNA reductase [Gulosibacter sediminis]